MRRLLIALFFLFLVLTGALGLKTDIARDCESPHADGTFPRRAEKIECYHMVAVTTAYLQDSVRAQSICEQIRSELGDLYEDDDVTQKAYAEANACYFDVAKITRNPSICYSIRKPAREVASSSALSGEEVSKDICLNVTGNLHALSTDEYYSNRDNLCAVVFILPLLLLRISLPCP